MKRLADIILAFFFLMVLALPIALIAFLVKVSSKGPILYLSDRIGKDNRVFRMPKFRTMYLGTPTVATHLLQDSGRFITPLGRILRKLSLDELPQLFSILAGDMSFVGPRPALFNQEDLIALRTRSGVHSLTPGLTGWAQVHGRDDLPIPVKVDYDRYYKEKRGFLLDLRILFMTVAKVFAAEGVHH
jgi:O-antigen biosynthesis protein WbqP